MQSGKELGQLALRAKEPSRPRHTRIEGDLPSITTLRVALDYSKETGELRWSKYWRKGRYAGKLAGTLCADGYRKTKIRPWERMLNSRIIWAHQTGSWPNGVIDHIDGDRGNDRLTNLRDVSMSQNSRNSGSAGGVSWDRSRLAWVARIKLVGQSVFLGRFSYEEEAWEAVHSARAMIKGQ